MKLNTWARQWLRRTWPGRPGRAPQDRRAAIIIVNFNTGELLSHLLFSIFRVLDRRQLARVVVVDNASTDLSRPLLEALRAAGLVDVLFNATQRYHGPALNQAMDHLATEPDVDYVWVLDSDTVVLRADALHDAVAFLAAHQASLVGQLHAHKAIPEGYAHVSSLLLDPVKVWRRGLAPFEEAGTPAKALQISLRRRGLVVRDFPFRSHNYILHLGRGTLAQIKEAQNQDNRYFKWASEHSQPHYHGNAEGARIHEEFLNVFRAEVPQLSPAALVAACQRRGAVQLNLPPPAEHPTTENLNA